MSEPLIKDVSDTAFWIAHHRAVENERSDALFHDPFASRLAGERGRAISTSMPADRMVSWSVAIRTRIIDEFLQTAIGEGADTILNLGAGLDARPYRMSLPASLLWIEADYPHVIEYKERLLAGEQSRCRLERVKIDLADRAARRAFLSGVDARSARTLVLTEGVVPYLTAEEVASLAGDLRAMAHARSWVVDYVSTRLMQYRRSRGMERQMPNARFRFETADWFGFFRQHGWESREVRYLADVAERLGRPLPMPSYARPVMRIMRMLAPRRRLEAMRKMAGYVLLEPC
jgi:methyltransferase (TIGR00027 family)